MKIIRSARNLTKLIARFKSQRKKIGFVPTMGFLHKGHTALLRRCRKENDISILSIFVNPAQFSPTEDYRRYPRDLNHDKFFAKKENVDIIFYPSVDDMYPKRYRTFVEVERLSNELCGRFRPGHFKGVATIVAKLLHIVSPDVMYLGQKDAQQAMLLTKMVEDLNFPTRIKILPTVREKDGLAMSSRNSYLNPQERKIAVALFQALSHAKTLVGNGEHNPRKITKTIRATLNRARAFKIDYIECRDAKTLVPLKAIKGRVLIALAAWLGKTRLIDNIVVQAK